MICVHTDGKEGLAPHIPPNSALSFDLTLLGFRARSPWVKPLIQDHSTHEKPYHADLKIYMEVCAFLSLFLRWCHIFLCDIYSIWYCFIEFFYEHRYFKLVKMTIFSSFPQPNVDDHSPEDR